MKFTGEKLQQRLRQQRETVILVGPDGIEHYGISTIYAADHIVGRPFIGYSKNGIVTYVRAVDAIRHGPFATPHDVAVAMRSFPRLPNIQKNP